jgi:hypothetical protein
MPTRNPKSKNVAAHAQRFEELRQKLQSTLKAAGITLEDLLATLPEARKRVYARLYGQKAKNAQEYALIAVSSGLSSRPSPPQPSKLEV